MFVTSFPEATVISITHRLDTIIDYDRILVLGDGGVLEYDTPKELLSRKDGVFTRMINCTGQKMATSLYRKIQQDKITLDAR